MKCPICKKGTMQVFKDRMPIEHIEYEAYRCSMCGEELLDMRQVGALAKEYRKLQKAKEITFAKWGNSIAVRIPNSIVEELQITPGKRAIIRKDKLGIVIRTA